MTEEAPAGSSEGATWALRHRKALASALFVLAAIAALKAPGGCASPRSLSSCSEPRYSSLRVPATSTIGIAFFPFDPLCPLTSVWGVPLFGREFY